MKVSLISLAILISLAVGLWALPTQNKTILSWDAVMTNVDGTPVTDLAGYRVYWRTSTGQYANITSKDVGNVLTVNIVATTGVLKGNYCFVVTAADTAGNESDFSNEVCSNFVNKKKAPTNLGLQ